MTSRIISIYCPHCHRHTSITDLPNHHGQTSWSRDFQGIDWFIGVCNFCKNTVLSRSDGGVVWPNPMPSETAAEIPPPIRENLIEAKQCNAVSAFRATVVMCRRAIQMACVDRGANRNDSLVVQIKSLKQNGVITNELHEWATVVRWVGNDGAHPGGVEPDAEDASAMLDLAEQFLHVLYVAPAKAAAHRAKLGK